jgi:hypothetical protein
LRQIRRFTGKLALHRRRTVGDPDHHRAIYTHLGFDVPRMECGIEHLKARFHNLTPSLVRFHAAGGMFGGLALFDLNEDALYWLRMRQDSTLRNMQAIREQ